jgi:glycosyltransferase involved in cell wall biosynthesis
MNNPKVSIIIAVYNAERYLNECLGSVVQQDYCNVEILVINDGSTDKSLAIAEQFSVNDSRISIFTKQNEGLGAASARNHGLERAKGDFILFLDADDFFESDMVSSMVRRALETESDIVVVNGYEFDDKDKRKLPVSHILNTKFLPDKEVFCFKDVQNDIYNLSQGYAWNKLFKKSFLDKHGLRFQRVKFTDDAYFVFMHMALAQRIATIDKRFVYYRVNSGCSQSDGLTQYPDSSYIPYIALKQSLVQYGIYEEVKCGFVNCAATFLRNCYDKLRTFEAFQYLHNKFKNQIFDELDINCLPKECFADPRVYDWICLVRDNEAGGVLFNCARGYGTDVTTAILRFQFPYELVPHRSRVVLFGGGLIGRSYCAQIMLSAWVDLVAWVETVNPEQLHYISHPEKICEVEFDYVLISYGSKDLREKAKAYLCQLGVSVEKVICES